MGAFCSCTEHGVHGGHFRQLVEPQPKYARNAFMSGVIAQFLASNFWNLLSGELSGGESMPPPKACKHVRPRRFVPSLRSVPKRD
jgi:hypothetical protein